jgi:membrane protease subunit (stomatin/prohibitin family)
MARCHRCQKEFGRFEAKIEKVVDGNRLKFCTTCASLWDEERKKRLIADLSQGGLITYFIVSRVTTKDEKEASNELIGHLLFTDKAVVFAQLTSLKKEVSGGGAMFGVIGILVSEVAANREHKNNLKKALAEMRQPDPMQGQQETQKILDKASSLVVIPKNSIVDIKSKGESIDVKTNTRYHRVFNLIDENVCRVIEPQIRGYLQSPARPAISSPEPPAKVDMFVGGKSSNKQRRCNYCGTELNANAKFCGKCGKKAA